MIKMSILEQVHEQYSCYNTSRYLARYLYLKNIARVFAKPAEYCGKRVVQWQSQGIERRHALVFLCRIRVFMCKNAFGFCLLTEILTFWYFLIFLMRRKKSFAKKGVIEPSFCTPGKIITCVSSFNLSSTWPCVF